MIETGGAYMQKTMTDYFSKTLDLEQQLIVKREELRYYRQFAKLENAHEDKCDFYMQDSVQNYAHEVAAEISVLLAQKKQMKKLLQLLSKPQYKTVLQLRYFCGLTVDQISNRMNYTPRHVKRLQSLALKELESKIKI